MKDTVAETVAERFKEVVGTLEGMGLRTESILRGMEIALEKLRRDHPKPQGDD